MKDEEVICCGCLTKTTPSAQDWKSGTSYCPTCNLTTFIGHLAPPKPSTVDSTIQERGKVYGELHHSHHNIGLAWTALIQQHYGIKLDHPLPDFIVELMMVAFKVQRSSRVYHADNYVDLEAYARFAKHAQENPGTPYTK